MKLIKRFAALILTIVLMVSVVPLNHSFAATENEVSLTLYNDTVLEDGAITPTPHTDSYTWKTDTNSANVFRLVVSATLSKSYSKGDVEFSIDTFSPAGRDEPIKRKSFGNASGVIKETGSESFNSGITAENTAAINGKVSFSITYQIKPEEIKDLGTTGNPLSLSCTMKVGSETVKSNTVLFSTDFEQGWSIINSGSHDEAYDEIEVYKVNENAPSIRNDFKTIDGNTIPTNGVSTNTFYWVEYRVPVLSDDPLGLYKHYIEVSLPDGCGFYSAQYDAEDSSVTPPVSLNYKVDSDNNKVVVDCVDFINKAHSAEKTDSYYYFVIALDKSLHSNTNVVTFREKHIHKDKSSLVVYSENTETVDQSLSGWTQNAPVYTNSSTFGLSVAQTDLSHKYKRATNATSFSLPVDSSMRINSNKPFITNGNNSSYSRTYLDYSEFDVSAVEIPAHYLNDNGEVVYGISYSLYTSTNGTDFTLYKAETVTQDATIKLPDGIKEAYVVYTPTNKSSSKSFYTFGSGDYSYKVSPTFEYEFFINESTDNKLSEYSSKFVGIMITGEDNDNRGIRSSMTNYIRIDDLEMIYNIEPENDAVVTLSGNHYDVTPTFRINYFSNTTQRDFSEFKLVAVIPDNYYGNAFNSTENLLEKVKNSLNLNDLADEEPIPFVISKRNADGSTSSQTVTSQNISDYISVSVKNTSGSEKALVFDFDFGDYSIKVNDSTYSFLFSFTWPMSRVSGNDLGQRKTFDMIVAMFAENAGVLPAPKKSALPSSTNKSISTDDGSFAESSSAISISKSSLSDADSDGNTTENAYFARTVMSVYDTGETAQSAQIFVETEYTPLSQTTYSDPALTRSGKDYTLSFVYENYSSDYKQITFISSMGNCSEDISDWKGNFLGVESVTASITDEVEYKVYFTNEDVDLAYTAEDYTGDKSVNLYPYGDWFTLDYSTNYSEIKAIAVIVEKPDGTVFEKEDIITCNINMKADDSKDYNRLYNKARFYCAAITNEGYGDDIVFKKSLTCSDYVFIQKFDPSITYIKRIKADSVNLDNGVPTFFIECFNNEAGVSHMFEFGSESDYETIEIDGEIYYQLTYTINRELDFGSYKIIERDSLRYDTPVIKVREGDSAVNSDNSVSLTTSFDNPDVTVVSTSEKNVYRGLSHNAVCVNDFDNSVTE